MRSLFCFFLLFLLIGSESRGAVDRQSNSLLLTADLTWASKYMINGFNVGGDKPVWQFAAKGDLHSTGFSFMYWTSIQVDRNNKQYDEQDLFILYSRDFFKNTRYLLNFHGFYDYWIFPNRASSVDEFGAEFKLKPRQGNKFNLGFSMPGLFPFAGSFLVPTYNIFHWLHWEEDRRDLNRSGTSHEVLLEYFRSMKILIPGATYQYVGLTSSVNYHEGAFEVEPGLSHTTASIVMGAYVLKSIFAMSLNQQWTYEKTLNPTDELWSTFSYIKKF